MFKFFEFLWTIKLRKKLNFNQILKKKVLLLFSITLRYFLLNRLSEIHEVGRAMVFSKLIKMQH